MVLLFVVTFHLCLVVILDGYNLRIFIRIQYILNWSYKRNEWISVLYFLFIWLCVIMICDFVLNTNTCWIFLHYWITYCDEIEYTYHFKTHTSTRLRVCYLVCQIISHLDEINGEQNGDGMCVWLRCYFEGRNWKIFVKHEVHDMIPHLCKIHNVCTCVCVM